MPSKPTERPGQFEFQSEITYDDKKGDGWDRLRNWFLETKAGKGVQELWKRISERELKKTDYSPKV